MTTPLARAQRALFPVTLLAGTAVGLALAAAPPTLLAQAQKKETALPNVQVVVHDADRRVDITVDNKPFTSVHLADHAEETGAVSAPLAGRHGFDARLSATAR